MNECVFCRLENMTVITENELALAFYDACPVSEGHTLVIPRRHCETYFEASPEEQAAIAALIHNVRRFLDKKLGPDGYNIGANVGPAAGQTVFHYHMHVIPRYRGDVLDPKGGVRKVIPGRGNPAARP